MKKLILILIIGCVGLISHAQQDSLKIFFVGNSYTLFNNGLDNAFELLAADNFFVDADKRAVTGAHLWEHWNDYFTPSYITAGGYDYVAIQDHSQTYADAAWRDSFTLYTHKFDSVITESGATTLLFMTWRKEDSTSNWTDTIAAMYNQAGATLNRRVVPCGIAWETVTQQYPYIDLYIEDGSHPTDEGTYLNACMFYASIYNKSPIGLSLRTLDGTTLPDSMATHLQTVAWDTYKDFYNPGICDTIFTSISATQDNYTGEIDLTVESEYPIKSYLWSNGSTSQDLTNLLTGTYSVVVTDSIDCQTIDSYTMYRKHNMRVNKTKITTGRQQ